jgi:hypothetical protein
MKVIVKNLLHSRPSVGEKHVNPLAARSAGSNRSRSRNQRVSYEPTDRS